MWPFYPPTLSPTCIDAEENNKIGKKKPNGLKITDKVIFTRGLNLHEPVREYDEHTQVCLYPIDPMTDSYHIPTSISEQGI